MEDTTRAGLFSINTPGKSDTMQIHRGKGSQSMLVCVHRFPIASLAYELQMRTPRPFHHDKVARSTSFTVKYYTLGCVPPPMTVPPPERVNNYC